ncbi:MAG: ArsA-related P-loop ATPase [Actinomycetota bacterium]
MILDQLADVGVAVVAGKGGVGSSTVAAAAALAAARNGADVLFVSVDGKPGIGPLLGGRELDENEHILRKVRGAGRVRGRTIPAEQAFGDYLELRGVGGLLRRAAAASSLGMIAAATPGLEHLLVLGKIKELERDGAADLIVVDAPPAGNAVPFLRSATGLVDVVNSGAVRDQADEVDELLRDPQRCAAMVVTLAEETPVNESIELADELVSDVGIAMLPVVANACWPERPGLARTPLGAARAQKHSLSADARRVLETSSGFGASLLQRQERQLGRLHKHFEHVVRLPRLPTARLALHHLGVLADALADEEQS